MQIMFTLELELRGFGTPIKPITSVNNQSLLERVGWKPIRKT